MFNSLPQFYQSEVWRKFRGGLIADRTSKADGILYDELTHQPLLKPYDIVLHHIQPLTLKNVNDYSISLNPDNIMIVSQRSHNELHARFGYCTERKVYYIYGAPCSGKTTFVNNIKAGNDLIVDIDNLWECLTGTRYDKPDALKQNVFQLRDCLLDMIKTRAGRWERAFIITSGVSKGQRERDIERFGAEPIFIEATPEECRTRLINDKTRSDKAKEEWLQYINRWFENYTE